MKITKKHGIALILLAIILIGVWFIPVPEGLSIAGRNIIALVLALLVSLVALTDLVAVPVTCLILTLLFSVYKTVDSFAASFSGYTSTVVFFILASFVISAAFVEVPLSKRILKAMLRRCGGSIESIILAIMITGAFVSGFISNVPTTALFMSIGLSLLDAYEDPTERKKTGRTVMIAIPVSTMIGGIMTPIGSTPNLVAIGLLESLTGETVTFVQWMCLGVPVAVVLLPLSWLIITKIHRPAPLEKSRIAHFTEEIQVPAKLERGEKSFLLVLAAMFVLWILSSWISSINSTFVALAGSLIFLLPGIGVLQWKKFAADMSWDVFFMTATVCTMGNIISAHGVSAWLVDSFYPKGMVLSEMGTIGMVALFTFVMVVIVSNAGLLVTVMSAPLIATAAGSGFPPALLLVVLSMCATNCYLLPIDTVPLLTYGTGYYKAGEMAKSNLWIQLLMVLLCAVWFRIAGQLLF